MGIFSRKKSATSYYPPISSPIIEDHISPDLDQYPVTHVLMKTLITEGRIIWTCCKCANSRNVFEVHPSELDKEELVQPFYLWGDSFCDHCSHNFCSVCIEGHSRRS